MPKKNLTPRRRQRAKASANRNADKKNYVPIPPVRLGTGKVTAAQIKKQTKTSKKLFDALTAFDRKRKKLGL